MKPEDFVLEIDQIIFTQKNQHLTDIQIDIIEGVFNRKSYSEIAHNSCCSLGHVKDVAYDLWKILSEYFGEQVNKSNLRSAMLRNSLIVNTVVTDNSSISASGHSFSNISNVVNYCESESGSKAFLSGQLDMKRKVEKRLKDLNFSSKEIADFFNFDEVQNQRSE
jgi:hypothetical protein